MRRANRRRGDFRNTSSPARNFFCTMIRRAAASSLLVASSSILFLFADGFFPSSEDALSRTKKKMAESHLLRGNDLYASNRLSEAATEYESCLSIDPSQRYCSINLASVLVDLGGNDNVVRAEKLYREALKSDPNDGDASYNLALLLQDRKTEESTRECATLYDVAVKSDPDRWDAWANLASALSELGERPLRAIDAYERSILLIERATEGEGENIERDAYLSKLYYGYGMVLAGLNKEDCATLASSPRSLLIGSERTKDNKRSDDDEEDEGGGTAVCAENAQNALRTSVILDATNVQASHMLAAMVAEDSGDDGVHRRATPEFVAALFDDFADTFDDKLGALEYRVPGLVGRAAREALENRWGMLFRSALDAGCGTGLAGRFLRPLVDGPLVGVDISRKMLDVARECTTLSGCGADDEESDDDAKGEGASEEPLYDKLAPLDLEAMTLEDTLLSPDVGRSSFLLRNGGTEGFDLVVAADVLVYFGRLDSLLANFARLSSHGATLIFSCERADPTEAPLGWRLLSSGRFSHAKEYVVKTAGEVGYELVGYDEIVPRMEKGKEVKGHLFRFVLRNENDDEKEPAGDGEL